MWQELEYSLDDQLAYEVSEADYSVIGPVDDRFPIPARRRRPSTLLFPTNTICLLEILDRDGSVLGTGTGTLIAPQVVLTAKHVLMDVQPPRCRVAREFAPALWFPAIRVTPGADLTATDRRLRRPAGTRVASSSRFRAHPDLDYGVIILPRPFSGPGRFMMLQARSRPRTATLLTIAGYPCDKPAGTMWGHSERIPLTGVTDTHLFYTIDTCPGHSGSPIWLLGNDEIRLLLGVHTSGVPTNDPGRRCENDPVLRRCRRTAAPVTPVGGQNCGVRVTCDVINTIVGWCQEFGVREPVIDRRVYRRRCGRSGRPVLRRGSRGSAVRDLQARLNRWLAGSPRIGLPPLQVDGIFGRSTDRLVRAFQRDMRITVDGVVGAGTWGRLLAVT
jgi:V8-like Glu-specific endopeptidase